MKAKKKGNTVDKYNLGITLNQLESMKKTIEEQKTDKNDIAYVGFFKIERSDTDKLLFIQNPRKCSW